jgi:hypothetical protein
VAHTLILVFQFRFLTNLNNSVTRLQAGFDPWPRTLKGCQERRGSTVAQADPDEFDFRLGLFCEVNEIFILADNNVPLNFGVSANVAVQRGTQAGLQDVLAIETALAQIFRYRRGQLIIN